MAKRTVEVLVKAQDQTKKAVDSAGKGFKGLEKTIANNAKAIAGFAAAGVAAIGAVTTAAYKLLDSTAKMEDALAKAAKRSQLDVQIYGEWAHVVQLAGGSAAQLEKAVAALSRQMLNAERGSLESVEAFAELGINVWDAAGNLKATDVILEQVINSLSAMEDKTKQVALAQVLMGRGGKMLIPVLSQTSDEIKAQRQEYLDLGGDAITAASETGEAWVDAQLRVSTAMQGLRASFLSAFGPEVITLINGTAVAIANLGDETRRLNQDIGFPSFGSFVNEMQAFATVAPASINLITQVDQALRALTSGNIVALPGEIEDVTEAIGRWEEASARAALQKAGLTLDLPGADQGKKQLTEYNDLLKISRAELEGIAQARGVAITDQRPDLPGVDVPRTSEAIAEDLVEIYRQAVEKASPQIIAEVEKLPKITTAAAYEAEDITDDLTQQVWLYEDIINRQKENARLIEEINAKNAERLALIQQLSATLLQMPTEGDQAGVDPWSTDQLEEGFDAAATAAGGLSNAMGTIAVDAPFKAMTGGAIKFADVMKTTVLSAIKAVIRQLLVAKALGYIGKAFGLEQGGQVPALAYGGAVPKIPRAAYGYSVPDGPRGYDSRLIMASPGEEVINRQLSQRLDRYLTSHEAAAYASPYGSSMGGGSGGGGTVVMNIGIPDSMAGLQRMQDGIIESLSEGGVA